MRGAPDNTTTRAIGCIVDFVAHGLTYGDDRPVDRWLIQAPIALITYLVLAALPIVFGGVVIEWWALRHEERRTTGNREADTCQGRAPASE
ncbi:hypothetical protein BZL54_21760 [Burkholderia ubonensis subsp. mesacidophila]|uniref:Uncharacterized protein n=1 Tax=Burkholderia ubonensis subsp. mesacidophila TaxID=265293 RepID=A0A2A4FCD5_9BURK|nr:hypothetical protein BZL54_21760 [Burkholderia ubonensis subsp. mesacidophila]